ncbi:MAG: hypothetical protein U0324_19035 [Polyangiales bacterium]
MSKRRWSAALGAAVWLGAGAASAQPVEVACGRDCRDLRVRGGGASVRVEVRPGAVELTGAGPRPGTSQTLRLTSDDGVVWRASVTTTTPPPIVLPPVAPAQRAPVVVAPRPPAPRPQPAAVHPLARRYTRMTAFGRAGIIAGAVGGVVGTFLMFQRDEAARAFNAGCALAGGEPPPTGACRDHYDDVMAMHTGMVASFALAAASLVGGVVTLALRPRANAWLTVAPAGIGAGIAGRF